MSDAFDQAARQFAAEIVQRAADDQIARYGIIHAATMLFASLAIEQEDPEAAVTALVNEMLGEIMELVAITRSFEGSEGGAA